jgi:uracil-DNA glycosylase family 4
MSTEHPKLQALRQQAESCRACPLNQLPYNPGKLVFGFGSNTPRVMFVGEAPGEREALVGLPFVGPAGKLLQQGLRLHGYKMSEIYITNVAKHRPPGNRNPSEEEVRTCGSEYLMAQVELLRPKYIVALGKISAYALASLSEEPVTLPKKGLRGIQFVTVVRGVAYPVYCTWHPAYCLRNDAATPQLNADLQTVNNKVLQMELLLGGASGAA